LPEIKSENSGSIMKGPTTCSNWVIRGRVLCGEYPGNTDEETHFFNLRTLVHEGVSSSVCLMEKKELQHFRPYFEDVDKLYKELKGPEKTFEVLKFPIEDGGEAANDLELLNFINKLVDKLYQDQNELIYIHCWAGRGRTGIIAACLLGILYNLKGMEALQRTNLYYKQREIAYGDSPEYHHQQLQVIRVLQLHEKLGNISK